LYDAHGKRKKELDRYLSFDLLGDKLHNNKNIGCEVVRGFATGLNLWIKKESEIIFFTNL